MAVIDRSIGSIGGIRPYVVREQRKPDAAHDPAHERVVRLADVIPDVIRLAPGAAQETLRGGGEEREETHVFVRGVRQVAAQPLVLRIARLDDVVQRRRVAPAGAQRQETLAQVRRRRLAEEEGVREKKGCEMRTGNAGAGGSRRAETRGGETGGRETRTSCGAAFANARSAGMTAPDDDIGRRPLVPPPMLCRGSRFVS